VNANWRPRSRRDDASYDLLSEGVPEWLDASAWEWLLGVLQIRPHGVALPNNERLRELERRLRVGLDWSVGGDTAMRDLRQQVYADPDLFLDALDLGLNWTTYPRSASELEDALSQAGSAWRVVPDGESYRLELRVDATAVEAKEAAIALGGRAAEHLKLAWSKAYGLHPDASAAYQEAVRAVESAAMPIISPLNAAGTLGTIIRDVRQKPSKWQMRLKPPAGHDPMVGLLEMLELLWKSEFDRHGSTDESVPLHVSVEEARDAVHLATTLTQWFRSGAVAPRALVR